METEKTTKQLYEDIIGVQAPWMVTAVIKDEIARKITVRIEYDREKILACPICARSSKRYDHRVRVLRYLDTCQYETFLEVHVPRIKCKKDGVQQIAIPFAEKHFTEGVDKVRRREHAAHTTKRTCGFRNRERFRTAILFHLGNLNMEFSTI
jgi:transposase